MTLQQPSTLSAIAAIAAPYLATSPAGIRPDTPLRGQVDSLAMIDLVVAAEDAFGIRIPDDAAEQFQTVGDIVDFISQATHC